MMNRASHEGFFFRVHPLARGAFWSFCFCLTLGVFSATFGQAAHGATTTAKFCVNRSQVVFGRTKSDGCGKGETKVMWNTKSKAVVCVTATKTLKYAKTGTCPRGSTRASLRAKNGVLPICTKVSSRQLLWKSSRSCPKTYAASPLTLQVAEFIPTLTTATTVVTNSVAPTSSNPNFSTSTTLLPFTTTIPNSPTTSSEVPSTTTSTSTSTTTSTTTTTVPAAPSSISYFIVGATPINQGDTTYLWASYNGTTATVDNGIGAMPNGLSVNISPTVTTTYTLTVTNGAGHTSTATVTITVIPTNTTTTTVPTGTTTSTSTTTTTVPAAPSSISYFIVGATPINQGDTTYLWASYNGTTATVDNGIGAMPNGLSVNISPTVTTTYTLTVTNGAGHTSTATVTITVIPTNTTTTTVPTGTTTSTSTTTTTVPAAPSSISYFIVGATPINQGDTTYLWASYNGTTATVDNGIGAMPNGLSVNISPTVTTTYTLTVTNGAGHTSTATVTITVIPTNTTTSTTTTVPSAGNTISIGTQPSDSTVLLGNSHTFSVDATASGTLSYQWYLNDAVIDGATSNQYTTTAAGAYKVRVQSTLNGSTQTLNSATAALTLRGASITSVSQSAYVTQGRNVSISASISIPGGISATYQWQLDGIDIPNTNSVGILATQGGDYTIIVTSSRNNLSMSQTSANIHVTSVQAPTVTSFDSMTQTIAYGGSVDLVPVFSNGTGVISPGNIVASSSNHVRVSPQTTTTYTLVVSNLAGTQVAMNYTVTVTTGVFTNVSNSMNVGRYQGSTSVALNDGRVLIFGNSETTGTVVSDIFVPSTNSFSRTGDSQYSHRESPGILLANGKVLVAGGIIDALNYRSTSTAEVFDPLTDTWSVTGSMSTERRGHFMIRLTNGKVLVGGGTDYNQNPLSSVELYDPATGLFSVLPNMPSQRQYANTALLPNGNVIVIGGRNGTGQANLTSAIIFDITANTWSSVSSQMPFGHEQGSVLVTLNDGRIMLAGGIYAYGGTAWASNQTTIFDPTTSIFSNGPNLVTPRYSHTAHVLQDGKVVFIGGHTPGDDLTTVEIYDPATNRMIQEANSMSRYRNQHSSALLQDGRVLIAGGNLSGARTGEIFTE